MNRMTAAASASVRLPSSTAGQGGNPLADTFCFTEYIRLKVGPSDLVPSSEWQDRQSLDRHRYLPDASSNAFLSSASKSSLISFSMLRSWILRMFRNGSVFALSASVAFGLPPAQLANSRPPAKMVNAAMAVRYLMPSNVMRMSGAASLPAAVSAVPILYHSSRPSESPAASDPSAGLCALLKGGLEVVELDHRAGNSLKCERHTTGTGLAVELVQGVSNQTVRQRLRRVLGEARDMIAHYLARD